MQEERWGVDTARYARQTQWSGQPAFPALALIRYSTVDFWIMYKNLQIHAMRATFHIIFSVRI
jgi:hypothetical protein